MKRIIVALCITLTASATIAQQQITKLQCSGEYNDFQANLKNLEIKDGYLEVYKDYVKVFNFVALGGSSGTPYHITRDSEAGILFKNTADPTYYGYLDRHSGKLQLTKGDISKVKILFFGNCRPAKALF